MGATHLTSLPGKLFYMRLYNNHTLGVPHQHTSAVWPIWMFASFKHLPRYWYTHTHHPYIERCIPFQSQSCTCVCINIIRDSPMSHCINASCCPDLGVYILSGSVRCRTYVCPPPNRRFSFIIHFHLKKHAILCHPRVENSTCYIFLCDESSSAVFYLCFVISFSHFYLLVLIIDSEVKLAFFQKKNSFITQNHTVQNTTLITSDVRTKRRASSERIYIWTHPVRFYIPLLGRGCA